MGELIVDFLTAPDAALRAVLHAGRRLLAAHGLTLAVATATALAIFVTARRMVTIRRRQALLADARVVTILAPPEVDPAGGEALWSNLIGLLRPAFKRLWQGQPHLAMEYVFTDAGVGIQLWVPGPIPPRQVEAAVQAAWPGAHTHTQHATASPLPDEGGGQQRVVVAGELRLARTEALPLRTTFDADPLRAVLGAPVGLDTDETACVQVLARPATGRRRARARRAGRRLHRGASPQLAGRVLDLITPGPRAKARRPGATTRPRLDPISSREQSAQATAVTAKDRGSAYETLVRYAVATRLAANASRADLAHARTAARGRAHALAAAFATYTDLNHYTRRRLRRPATAITERRLGSGDLLSVPELAALAHLPTDENSPGLRRAGAQAVAPPPGVAETGPTVKPLGQADTGRARTVGLRVADARQHLHVIGATGSGKSTLLAQLILDDAESGRGAVVIDPKGDLITDILDRLPERAAERLVLFDADTRGRIPCLNPLDGGDVDREVDNLTSVFRRVYAAYWGPRTDDVMRAAALTLRAQPGVTTLADIPKLLTDAAYRARATNAAAVQANSDLALFWRWYTAQSDAARSVVISPLLNKLRSFLLRPFPRAALAAGENTVDFAKVLDGGILLARIPKGSLGEETCRLIGSLIVARTWQATTARAATTDQDQRRDASLYIDECHNFLNLPYPIEDMLAEARGYRLAMTLAHQHLRQLPRELAEGISTNARSKVFFTASPGDAHLLARHTQPRLSEHDLAHLGAYRAAARLVVAGEQAPPFTLATRPLGPVIAGRARLARRLANRPPQPPERRVEPEASTDPRRAA